MWNVEESCRSYLGNSPARYEEYYGKPQVRAHTHTHGRWMILILSCRAPNVRRILGMDIRVSIFYNRFHSCGNAFKFCTISFILFILCIMSDLFFNINGLKSVKDTGSDRMKLSVWTFSLGCQWITTLMIFVLTDHGSFCCSHIKYMGHSIRLCC